MALAEKYDITFDDAVAIGDLINDIPLFEIAEHNFAVSNADERARTAADTVLEAAHADGTLLAIDRMSD
jgi:hydroxymethylpyrimidine pyrophosphatase-like HAD family hydrolase